MHSAARRRGSARRTSRRRRRARTRRPAAGCRLPGGAARTGPTRRSAAAAPGAARPRIRRAAATPSSAAAVQCPGPTTSPARMHVRRRTFRQQLPHRLDADADEHGVGAELEPSVSTTESTRPETSARMLATPVRSRTSTPCARQRSASMQPDLVAEHARDRRRRRLDDRHVQRRGERGRGDLGADEAAADHDEARARDELRRGARVRRRACAARARPPAARAGGGAAARPSRGRGASKGSSSPRLVRATREDRIGGDDAACRAASSIPRSSQNAGLRSSKRRLVARAGEELLRERRPLVRRDGLLADEQDAPVEPFGAERLGGAGAGEAGAHDHARCGGSCRLLLDDRDGGHRAAPRRRRARPRRRSCRRGARRARRRRPRRSPERARRRRRSRCRANGRSRSGTSRAPFGSGTGVGRVGRVSARHAVANATAPTAPR